MFGQSFQTADLASIVALVFLEALLSADNALVLAIMVRHLPKDLRQKALLYGLVGAFVFRLVAILLASLVLQLWWLQALGAAYLIFLPIKHFWSNREGVNAKPVQGGFWQTVIAVEFTDIAFAIDSVLAGVSFVGNRQDKIWVVYAGAIVGMVLLRFAAGVFVRLLERFPMLDHVAYVLVGWVGAKLFMLSAHNMDRALPNVVPGTVPEMPHWLFWSILAGIATIGTLVAIKNARSDAEVAAIEEQHAKEIEAAAEESTDIADVSETRKPDADRVE